MLVLSDKDDDVQARLEAHQKAVDAWFGNVAHIKAALKSGDLRTAAEVWYTMPEQVRIDLWLSPRAGGTWTTSERALMKQPEFRRAYFENN